MEQSLLARLGIRSGILGSASSLAVAAPLSNNNYATTAHTDSGRIGYYFDRTVSAEKMGFVVLGSERLAITTDGITVTGTVDADDITADTVTADLTGNVLGDLTGNVLGNVTGNVTGDASGNAGTVTAIASSGQTTTYPMLATSATGSIGPLTNASLTYNTTSRTLAISGGTFSGSFSGNLTGDVTGNLTGNVTGNLTGTASNASLLQSQNGAYYLNRANHTGTNDADTVNGKTAAFLLSRANHTGTQLAATISDFDTQVRTSRLDQMAAPNASVSWNSQLLADLLDPINPQDAATKAYVDAMVQGLAPKDSVRAATTADITLSGTQTVDGVSLSVGDRVLVKNQTTQANNGLYLVASGAWTRTLDMDTFPEAPAAFVFVEEGTTNDNTGWVCTSNSGGTLGSTAITFAQFSGAGTYTAGSGLTLTGNQFSVNVDNSTLEINSNNLRIKDLGVTYAKIQNVSATDKILGRQSAGSGVIEEITCTSVARTLISQTTQALMRSNGLGLGTIATQNSNAASITGTSSIALSQSISSDFIISIANTSTGTAATSGFYASNDLSQAVHLLVLGSNNSQSSQNFGFTTNYGMLRSTAGSGLIIGQTGSADIIFATSTTEKMRLASGGTLLIGSTSVSGAAKLQVTGGISCTTSFTSTVATGTAPLVVSSTTNVANLNASSINGATFANPGSIGSGVAASGAFTTLNASSTAVLFGATSLNANVTNVVDTAYGMAVANSGSAASAVVAVQFGNNSNGARFAGLKTRAATTASTTAVQADDILALFAAYGADGSVYRSGAFITAFVDGSVSSGVLPTRISFSVNTGTTGATEQMRLGSTGNLMLANASFSDNATDRLQVSGSGTFTGQIKTTVAGGTAPLVITSTTLVNNLNVERLNSQTGSFYQNAGNLNAGTLLAARMPALTGDITTSAGAVATTLATVNSNVGSFTNANITVNAKGLITAASNGTGSSPAGSNTQVQFNNSGAFGASSSFTFNSGTTTLTVNGTCALTTITTTNGITLQDADVTLLTSAGTRFGTATNQKLAFYGSTPISQPTNGTDLRQAIINLGLLATGGATPLDLNGGALTAGSSGFGGTSNAAAVVTAGTTNPLTGTTQDGFFANLTGTSAATTEIVGFRATLATAATSFTCTDMIGFQAYGQSAGAGSTITRNTGFHFNRNNVATNSAGFSYKQNSSQPTFTGFWCIYNDSAEKNYLGTGATLINTTTDDGANKLQVAGSIASTVAGTNSLTIHANAGGRVASVKYKVNGSDTFDISSDASEWYLNNTANGVVMLEAVGAAVGTGYIRINNTTAASTTTSGALRVSGGAGIAGNLYVGGGIFSSTSLNGTSLSILSVLTNSAIATLTKTTATLFTTVLDPALVLDCATGSSDGCMMQFKVSGVFNLWGIKKGTNNHVLTVNTSGTPVDAITVDNLGLMTLARSLTMTGYRAGLTSKTGAYTATAEDHTILCDATSAGFTITLPAAASHTGRIFVIKKTDATANAVTIDGNASETIDGALTLAITVQYASYTIQSNGSNWFVL